MTFVVNPRSLAELVAETEGARLIDGSADIVVSDVTNDSRRVQRGALFVAVPGLERNGLDFVPQAIANGAAAIATESSAVDFGVPMVRVESARHALADLSAAFYGHPSRHLAVIGVTGTDGKTSTTHLISAILESHGLRTGWLTTVNTRIGDMIRANAVDHTTPEAPLVQRTLAEMLAAELDVAILETSSHALALDRVRGVDYKVGVFTNLSPEHINFHGSFEAYRAAKRLLFERLPTDGLAVLNADDPSVAHMREATQARVLTYALDSAADISASDVHLSSRGTVFTTLGRTVDTRLVGRFNVANWLAAYGAATYFGATADDLVEAARLQRPVPGRMNLVESGQPFAVIVDFAHTPQALEKAIDTVRSLVSGKLLLAFGLAGGRDAANRPVMGSLAARKSDYFVITMDDPGQEDPGTIASQIAEGARTLERGHSADFDVVLDRRAAIRLLFERARPGDAVLLAGKGHEQRMVVGEQRLPWNDACVAAEVLAELGFATQAVP